MDVLIGLGFLGLVVWYIYKKVGVAADVNADGKVDTEDAKVAMDMAVSSVSGMATGAAVAAANIVEEKIDKASEDIKDNIDAKTEEIFVKVMEAEAKIESVAEEVKGVVTAVETKVEETVAAVEEKVEEVVQKAKKGRKPKVK